MKNHLKDKLMTLVTLLSVIMVLNNCESGQLMTPVAITKLPSQVSLDRATLNGTVSAFNFMSTVSFEYGKTTLFGQSQNPPSNQIIGSTFSDVSADLTGLTPGTTYYYRLKAEFSGGTTFGNYEKFTTLDKSGSILFNSDLTYGSITDNDGNTYKTIQIGTQTWMAENLRTTKYNDGTAITLSENNWRIISPEPVYCWYNNNAGVYKDIYGAMYNWKTVNSGKLCPTGWHVPTVDEWRTLTTYLGERDIYKLKESGAAHWNYPNTRTTNESGFTALPGGYRDYDGIFHSIAGDGYWWCSTEAYTQGAFYRVMYSDSDFVLWGSWTKAMGLSVRCIKDN